MTIAPSRQPSTTPKRRCAVYTRKSTDEGLEQEYNSLEAQRDAALAFIASQKHEGWISADDGYDDGGFSGGNMNRPALKRLLADIEEGRVDVVVVYKIDRLSRSLADFARIVDLFDAHGVTFVSVTQQFNTTTSMGRLTLNILLSFAQFEREVTGERIRDKLAASKAKGMWMGGVPPLGYDIKDKKLVINEAEAALVREIFARYAEHGSAAQLARELQIEGRTTKSWVTQSGRYRTGRVIDQQHLFKMLRNRLYLGEISNHGVSYPGQHEAIVTPALWAAVHARIEVRKKAVRSGIPPRQHCWRACFTRRMGNACCRVLRKRKTASATATTSRTWTSAWPPALPRTPGGAMPAPCRRRKSRRRCWPKCIGCCRSRR